MEAKLKRRDLAAAILAPVLVQSAQGQPSSVPAEELRAAREQILANAKLLSDYSVPIDAEPAFSFKA